MGAGWSFSQSGSADSTNAGTLGGSHFGGITTGGGGMNTMVLVALAAVVLVLVLRK